MPLILQRRRSTARYFTQNLGAGIGIHMVAIPGGSFQMGSPPDAQEGQDTDEQPQHLVTVPSFCMGKYPVTQAQWRIVAGFPQVQRTLDPDPANFTGDDLPVESVSWLAAEEFCLRLSNYANREYRLPTEAEWEYACRAGTTTPFHFGKTIDSKIANYRAQDWKLGDETYSGKYGDGSLGEFREKTTPVGFFQVANRYGLYDMHGNVWEWCQDHWHNGYDGAPVDGSAWIDVDAAPDANRVLRGGSWYFDPYVCRSACRHLHDAYYQDLNCGLRLVSAERTL